MLIKPLKNKGQGSPKAVLRYLLDKPNNQATVLKGEPTISQALAESLSYQKPYEAWVLSFEEKELSEEVKHEIIEEFERAFLPYFQDDRSRYNITWIEHSDKDRVELNFFMPKVDLKTEKQISMFNKSRKEDWELANNFRDYINAHYNLTNPMDESKAQFVKGSDWLYKAKSQTAKDIKQLIDEIDKGSRAMLESGAINNRDELIEKLEMAGFEIARKRDKFITIKNPNGGRNIPLKGVLFDESTSYESVRAFSRNSKTIDPRERVSAREENRATVGNGRDRIDETLETHRNSPRNGSEHFRGKLEESIELRRKMQQRAFDELSGRGKAFNRIDTESRELNSELRANDRRDFSETPNAKDTIRRDRDAIHGAENLISNDRASENNAQHVIKSEPTGEREYFRGSRNERESQESLDGNIDTLEVYAFNRDISIPARGWIKPLQPTFDQFSVSRNMARKRKRHTDDLSTASELEQAEQSDNQRAREYAHSLERENDGRETALPSLTETESKLTGRNLNESSSQAFTPSKMYERSEHNARHLRNGNERARYIFGANAERSSNSEGYSVDEHYSNSGAVSENRRNPREHLEELRGNLRSIGDRAEKYRADNETSGSPRTGLQHLAQWLTEQSEFKSISERLKSIGERIKSIGEGIGDTVQRVREHRRALELEEQKRRAEQAYQAPRPSSSGMRFKM